MSLVIPEGASRIRVHDEDGRLTWRKISELKDTDKPYLDNNGEMSFMFGSPGRPSNSANNAVTAGGTTAPPALGPQGGANPPPTRKQRRNTFLKNDGVFSKALENPDSSDVLTNVVKGLAEESAALAFERHEAERRGEPVSQISLRRVNALKAVGDAWLKRKEVLTNKSIDLESRAFKILFGHIAETFRRSCDEAGMRPEMTDTVFAEFGKIVDQQEWVLDLKNKIEKG